MYGSYIASKCLNNMPVTAPSSWSISKKGTGRVKVIPIIQENLGYSFMKAGIQE